MTNLFILGAGFDQALYGPKIPLNSGLLGLLNTRCIDPAWKRHLEKYSATDIEQALTLLDLERSTAHDDASQYDRNGLRTTINQRLAQLMSEFRFKEACERNSSWALTFATQLLHPEDGVVSLNYTCLLEGLLDSQKVWSPNGGYSEHVPCPAVGHLGIPNNKNLKNIVVYKIHGSCHFHLSRYLDRPNQEHINFAVNGDLFPESGRSIEIKPDMPDLGRFLIAPSFVKALPFQLSTMVLEVLRRSENAKTLFILGCGLRPEDSHLRLVLTSFLVKTLSLHKRLIIVDPEADSIAASIKAYYSLLQERVSIIPIAKKIEHGLDDLLQYVTRPDLLHLGGRE